VSVCQDRIEMHSRSSTERCNITENIYHDWLSSLLFFLLFIKLCKNNFTNNVQTYYRFSKPRNKIDLTSYDINWYNFSISHKPWQLAYYYLQNKSGYRCFFFFFLYDAGVANCLKLHLFTIWFVSKLHKKFAMLSSKKSIKSWV